MSSYESSSKSSSFSATHRHVSLIDSNSTSLPNRHESVYLTDMIPVYLTDMNLGSAGGDLEKDESYALPSLRAVDVQLGSLPPLLFNIGLANCAMTSSLALTFSDECDIMF